MILGDGIEDMTLTIKGSALPRSHLGDNEVHDKQGILKLKAVRQCVDVVSALAASAY
jgi:hypothetical protein